VSVAREPLERTLEERAIRAAANRLGGIGRNEARKARRRRAKNLARTAERSQKIEEGAGA